MAQGFGFVGRARKRWHTLCISSLRAGATESKNKQQPINSSVAWS
jgi:hypothetical protein